MFSALEGKSWWQYITDDNSALSFLSTANIKDNATLDSIAYKLSNISAWSLQTSKALQLSNKSSILPAQLTVKDDKIQKANKQKSDVKRLR